MYPQKTFGREVSGVLLRAVVVILSFLFIMGVFEMSWEQTELVSDGTCNVAVFPIEGVILPFSQYDDYSLITTPRTVRDFVSQAENDPAIQAILFEINSPGGTPVASEQISEIIKSTSLQTASLIGDIGTSGGYLVAASAGTIIASAMSDVGSIGVTMSYVENSKQNEEEGLTFVELSSGKFKDSGNPNKALTDEERILFEEDLQLVHDEFVRQVAESRQMSVEEMQKLADGSSMIGARALEAGLVDKIGGRQEAKEDFAYWLQLDESEVSFCEYSSSNLFF
jgi:protease-4